MSYEKVPLDEREGPAEVAPLAWHRRLVAVALVAILLFSWIPLPRPWSTGSHKCDHSKKYAGEKISWEKIGEIEGRTLEQSRLDVPMDHFNATNSGNKTFDLHLIRLRGKEGSDNLLLNPGGKPIPRIYGKDIS